MKMLNYKVLTFLMACFLLAPSICVPMAQASTGTDAIEELIVGWMESYKDDENWKAEKAKMIGNRALPNNADLSQEDALRIALTDLIDSNETTIENLSEYRPVSEFLKYEGGAKEWMIVIEPIDPESDKAPYAIYITSPDGDIRDRDFGSKG